MLHRRFFWVLPSSRSELPEAGNRSFCLSRGLKGLQPLAVSSTMCTCVDVYVCRGTTTRFWTTRQVSPAAIPPRFPHVSLRLAGWNQTSDVLIPPLFSCLRDPFCWSWGSVLPGTPCPPWSPSSHCLLLPSPVYPSLTSPRAHSLSLEILGTARSRHLDVCPGIGEMSEPPVSVTMDRRASGVWIRSLLSTFPRISVETSAHTSI